MSRALLTGRFKGLNPGRTDIKELKENIFRYPEDILKRRIKYAAKVALALAAVTLLTVFIYKFSDPRSWRIANKAEMILVVSLAVTGLYLLFAGFVVLVEALMGSAVRATEIIPDEKNLTRKIGASEERFAWDGISKVKEGWLLKRTVGISRGRKKIFVNSDLERFEELISIIKERVPPGAIKRRSILELGFTAVAVILYAGLYLAFPELKPVLHILALFVVLFVLVGFPFSGVYGPRGKWLDWIFIVYLTYELVKTVGGLYY